jgi:hypothetical protein
MALFTVEVGCYGAGTDWICRLTQTSTKLDLLNDAYSPPPELGFFWLRESGGMRLASGSVSREVFRDAETVDELLDRVMNEVIHNGSQLARCIEFVATEFTTTFDGEQGSRISIH